MSVDALLFWGRVLFLVGLYLFLLFVVLSLSRDLRSRSASAEESAPGELVVVFAAESGLKPNDAFPLMTETLLGRTADNTIALPDATVSSRHGKLTHNKSGWLLEDLGSRNGTFVNGDRVAKSAAVKYGDVMAFGSVSVKLVKA